MILLYPFSIIYGFLTFIRNKCYDWGICAQTAYKIPVISVGNITVGGTGKTPFVEFLIKTMGNRYNIAVLSRGYKRNTKGVIVANQRANAAIIGDEPAQILNKYPGITVAVAEQRNEGMSQLMKIENPPEMVILDDAFQHRSIKPGFSILLIDYTRPLWNDRMLPAGRLREYACGAERADLFVITKCPDSLTTTDKSLFIEKINGATAENTFFSKISYGQPTNINGEPEPDFFKKHESFLVVTGIAKCEPFIEYLQQKGTIGNHFKYTDHHPFTIADVEIFKEANLPVVTTEKDATRLEQWSSELHIVYIPIETEFIDNGDKQLTFLLYKYLVNV